MITAALRESVRSTTSFFATHQKCFRAGLVLVNASSNESSQKERDSTSDEDIIRCVAVPKSVLCVSWNPSLASTRERLLAQAGYSVISALGEEEAASRCQVKADLLVLGHSVPRDKKEAVIKCFREHSQAPILSLLRPGQDKLPEADFAVEAFKPADFVQAVHNILAANR